MERKKSFFEKLTGAINTNGVEDVEVNFDEEDDTKNIRIHPSDSDNNDEVSSDDEDAQLTVDVYQTPTEIVIKTMVAGVKPDTLDIQISRDMVTLRGTRQGSNEVREEDYFYRELFWGTFSRTILLPSEVEVEEAEAVEEHGLLTLRLPKIDKERRTKLKVKSSR
jgi:HSP20 family protein